jgi:hypothetical protein
MQMSVESRCYFVYIPPMSNALSAFADDAEQWAIPVRDSEHDIHFRYDRKSPAYTKAIKKLAPAFQALDDMIKDDISRRNEKAKLLEQEYLRQLKDELDKIPEPEPETSEQDNQQAERPAPRNAHAAPPPVGGPPELKAHVEPPHARQAMTTKVKMNVRQTPHGALTPPPPTDEVFGTPSSRSDD